MPETCTVRALTQSDLPMVLAWRNHPDIRQYMLTQHEIGLEEHRRWFDRVQHDQTRQLLIVQNGEEPLGFVQFHPVSPGGIADWGFYARPDAPKGSGTKLGKAALAHAFKTLGLHKVCGQAIESNQASIAFHQKMGFTHEGRLRDQQRIGSQYHTLMCYGLLAADWQAQQLTEDTTHAPD